MKRGRKQRRSQWRALMKQGLTQAVVKVLAEQGLAGLTLEQVAREAGIAKGTLYLYFKDKNDLLRSAVLSVMEPLREELDRVLDSDLSPNQKLAAVVQQSLSYFEANRDFFRVFFNSELPGPNREARSRRQELLAKLARVFREGVKRGCFRPVPERKAAGVFLMGCAAMIEARLREKHPPALAQDTQLFLDLFCHGIYRQGAKR